MLSLACFMVIGLPVVAWPRDDDKPKANAPKRPALYDPKADARVQVEAAVAKARRGHSRVLVVFGFETCGWCHRLHALFEQDPDVRQLLREGYVEVLVDIKSPHAAELLKKCQSARPREPNPEATGFPFLGVLDDGGKVVTGQPTEPLEQGKAYDPVRVKEFLRRWAAPSRGAPEVPAVER
jgi:thioredoxin-related protein